MQRLYFDTLSPWLTLNFPLNVQRKFDFSSLQSEEKNAIQIFKFSVIYYQFSFIDRRNLLLWHDYSYENPHI